MSSLTSKPSVSMAASLASVHREDVVDRLAAMDMQAQSTYGCQDYLNREIIAGNGKCVEKACRTQICEWLYRVADHLNIDREVVMMAIVLLDQFMTSRPYTCRRNFRLAAMASLHLASKLYGGRTVRISFLAELSRGEFLIQHIAEMEQLLLFTLKWRVNPPTPLSFLQHFLALLPCSTPHALKEELFQYSRFFVELSSCDYAFVTEKCSYVAIASIINTFDATSSFLDFNFDSKLLAEFLKTIFTVAKLTKEQSHKMDNLKDRLWTLFMESEEYHSGASSHLSVFALRRSCMITQDYPCRKDGGNSPVCVSGRTLNRL
uniref:Cyclin-like domain-containing protein n=1 Tax=Helicotheca tamesis TaxID=374047 RepID=A0A7S2I9H3_9STRA|mmetsp:Transcript_7118/g.9636  ORF Transcript_7118/g.9636 Transcript_7118/m.9636 type:complete len:319 (+) Transcript_7118:147-1103(+)|eukprot:CAMPEP_0185731304 /NCGR_PEP_ID=MMETSP1171-20130828/12527_1 /TAXON_ID=374046 /ORGANISM="Helicotheca tamensis, Strain CCMP826" /LENGTH=318 /DNA_ID=CAMNT_0028400541 /DNA_START=143 /DNA_END=1099 /DNA_ORIENTATION=-